MLPVVGVRLNSSVWKYTNQVRRLSGYKINAENYIRKKHPDNFTDEDEFKEKVELCVLQKAKSSLRVFEKITEEDISNKTLGPNPNEKYMNRTDIPVYRSIQRYWKTVERIRREQIRNGVWWKTYNYWLKQQLDQGIFTNIGLIPSEVKAPADDMERRSKKDLEKAARERTLKLDMDIVNDEWEHAGMADITRIAHHYGIFKDLFENKDFLPVIHMDVDYECGEDLYNPVFYGNELAPSEVENPPIVTHEGADDKLWTLLLTNPDEHLEDNNLEYVHWLVGNIPGNDLSNGDTLISYLRPFPARGTGYQRMVFILFQQSERVDFTKEYRQSPCLRLRDRDFKTLEFYQKYEDKLIPASLRFFQCKWEDCVQETFHKILNMKEPVYEYERLSRKERLGPLKITPAGKTLTWLSKYMPKEPVYPDGSREEMSVRRQAALDACYLDRTDRAKYPIRRMY